MQLTRHTHKRTYSHYVRDKKSVGHSTYVLCSRLPYAFGADTNFLSCISLLTGETTAVTTPGDSVECQQIDEYLRVGFVKWDFNMDISTSNVYTLHIFLDYLFTVFSFKRSYISKI